MKSIDTLLMYLLLLLYPFNCFAWDIMVPNEDGAPLYYNFLDEGSVEVAPRSDNDNYYKYGPVLTIPASVLYEGKSYTVTTIGNEAFCGVAGWTDGPIDEIRLPACIKEIKSSAFSCVGLKTINLPNSLEQIGDYAFYWNGYLDVILPEGLQKIGKYAFEETGLSKVNIPRSVIEIGEGAFSNSAIQSVMIPGNVKYLGKDLFYACYNLYDVTIEEGVEMLSDRMFYSSEIYSVKIPGSITSFGEYAFSGCEKLTNVLLSEGLKEIGNNAFSGCGSLKHIELPKSLQRISTAAFFNSGLISIDIPNNVTNLGYGAFSFCDSLEETIISNGIEDWGVDYVDDDPFSLGCTFDGCENLRVVRLNDGLKTIGPYCFSGCGKLESIVIPNSITEIGEGAFGYSGLSHVEFFDNTNLKSLRSCCFSGTRIVEISIPNSVVNIENGVFEECSELKSIKLPDNLDVLPSYIFSDCQNLEDVDLPSQLIGIENSAFEGCRALKNIRIPSKVQKIDESAFDGCSALMNCYCLPYVAPVCKRYAFRGIHEDATLWVPKSSWDVYSYSNISSFFNNLKPIIDEPETPIIQYNGRYMSIVSTDDSEIHYRVGDGVSQVYHGSFDVMGIKSIKIWSVCVNPSNNEECASDTIIYDIPVYYDGDKMIVAKAGSLKQGFEWCNRIPESLIVEGELNNDDLINLCQYRDIKELDLREVKVKQIPDRAFENSAFVSVILPKDIDLCGKDIFRHCESLGAVVWTSNHQIPDMALSIESENALLYVDDLSLLPNISCARNIVVGGHAESIILEPGEIASFWCPIDFETSYISYHKDFHMSTPIGSCAGWETIALPFDVDRVRASESELRPFAVLNGEYTSYRPYWLMTMENGVFVPAINIKANMPYIISMPNNDDYESTFNISGDVVFEATNCLVHSTTYKPDLENLNFLPNYVKLSSEGLYRLNKEDIEGYPAGSIFTREKQGWIDPFEAYLISPQINKMPSIIPVKDCALNQSNSLSMLEIDSALNVGVEGDVLVINSKIEQVIKIYNLEGIAVRTLLLLNGKNLVSDLSPGVYVIPGLGKFAILK